jgi:hypothetical protein
MTHYRYEAASADRPMTDSQHEDLWEAVKRADGANLEVVRDGSSFRVAFDVMAGSEMGALAAGEHTMLAVFPPGFTQGVSVVHHRGPDWA